MTKALIGQWCARMNAMTRGSRVKPSSTVTNTTGSCVGTEYWTRARGPAGTVPTVARWIGATSGSPPARVGGVVDAAPRAAAWLARLLQPALKTPATTTAMAFSVRAFGRGIDRQLSPSRAPVQERASRRWRIENAVSNAWSGRLRSRGGVDQFREDRDRGTRERRGVSVRPRSTASTSARLRTDAILDDSHVLDRLDRMTGRSGRRRRLSEMAERGECAGAAKHRIITSPTARPHERAHAPCEDDQHADSNDSKHSDALRPTTQRLTFRSNAQETQLGHHAAMEPRQGTVAHSRRQLVEHSQTTRMLIGSYAPVPPEARSLPIGPQADAT
jgi:hypothetical protein